MVTPPRARATVDFSKVSIQPAHRADRSLATLPLAALALRTKSLPKLGVAAAHDRRESEADRIADQIARLSGSEPVCLPTPAIGSGGGSATVEREVPSIVHDALRSPGQPLDRRTRAFMEPRFGHDFSQVRVHTDAKAAASAAALDAIAYAGGRHIVFGADQYAPGSTEGRRLLAHELAHVAQQHSRFSEPLAMLYRKPKAIRFQNEPTLDEISDGKKVLKQGDKGEAVIRITAALADLGKYTSPLVDENFDPANTAAVTAYQNGKPVLAGKAPPGKVDKLTFDELDKDFTASYSVERDVAAKQKTPHLLSGTMNLGVGEKAAAARAISTETPVNPITGALPSFQPMIFGKGTYEQRLTTTVEKEIVDEFDSMGKGRAAAHANPGKLYDWTQIETIAKESQKAVDGVFGQYYAGAPHPPLKKGVNIFDAWADKVTTLSAGGKVAEDAAAKWRVTKIITGDDAVAALDVEHGAVQSRPAEAFIINKVTADMIAKHRSELIETHKGWPGYAGGGKIFIQVFKGATQNAQRRDMWDFFQTFIHEYIHTLEHPNHVAYRTTMTEQKGNKALREGATDYFTKIVWNGIALSDALRATIEGPFNDPVNKFAVPPLNTYRESENAERLAGVVGLRNVMAAFFLGKIELIGKP
jgi:hypothetical protein